MPCDCQNCDCTYEDYNGATVCIFTRKSLYSMGAKEEREEDCPLVEIKDFMEIK